MSDDEDALLNEDKDDVQIRDELSHMSFEDLQKLKNKLGTKVYNETIFGAKETKKKTDFKRANKNRPREMSSKNPVPRHREIVHVKKRVLRDPRFDSLCGSFNEKAFNNTYAFINGYRRRDVETLQAELKQTKDPKRIKKIKYLIQRLQNQIRERKKVRSKELSKEEEKINILEALKRGERPVFKKKSEKKVLDLVSQYEELKKTGKIEKHIKRLRKKHLSKDRAKLRTSESE